ncbi:hypothetical protein Q5P01_014753 [Channa striata]|uniref:DUF4524 domain-containing protein n=1 Tax=Channa striata TaxID=64152 RepID=A0AA88MG54_CHASR|nr:hypothetical protein Q5P01_014753 [Channa striata]
MYEDESVDVRCSNGSQLQVSPCGSEFVLVKARDPCGHPLQSTERLRQRTRFTISAHKELMLAALAFRNKYAARPYLPKEIIPADCKKPFFSIDLEVQWPEWSSCETEVGPGGETIIKSEEGQCVLVLSPSGEEFSVEFTCGLSQGQINSHLRDPDSSPGSQQKVSDVTTDGGSKEIHQGRRSARNETDRSRSCSPRIINTAQTKPEELYQSTTVVQHHSCSAVAPMWCYPLSLARHRWTTHQSKSKDDGTEATSHSNQMDRKTKMSSISSDERKSRLPQSLPLTCPSPHRHRWQFKDPLAKQEISEQDLPAEPVKVMWCQGVTYRILSGAVSVVEVSPGDGSVIRSNGVLNTYFTHQKPDRQSGQVKEVTYHLNSLPPDILGQAYSIGSIVSRASRILTCYNQAKHSLKFPVTPSCLQEFKDGHFSDFATHEENLSNPATYKQHTSVTQAGESLSDLVAAELEKIKRFNFLLDNSHLLRCKKESTEPQAPSAAEEVTHDLMNESHIDRHTRTCKDQERQLHIKDLMAKLNRSCIPLPVQQNVCAVSSVKDKIAALEGTRSDAVDTASSSHIPKPGSERRLTTALEQNVKPSSLRAKSFTPAKTKKCTEFSGSSVSKKAVAKSAVKGNIDISTKTSVSFASAAPAWLNDSRTEDTAILKPKTQKHIVPSLPKTLHSTKFSVATKKHSLTDSSGGVENAKLPTMQKTKCIKTRGTPIKLTSETNDPFHPKKRLPDVPPLPSAKPNRIPGLGLKAPRAAPPPIPPSIRLQLPSNHAATVSQESDEEELYDDVGVMNPAFQLNEDYPIKRTETTGHACVTKKSSDMSLNQSKPDIPKGQWLPRNRRGYYICGNAEFAHTGYNDLEKEEPGFQYESDIYDDIGVSADSGLNIQNEEEEDAIYEEVDNAETRISHLPEPTTDGDDVYDDVGWDPLLSFDRMHL